MRTRRNAGLSLIEVVIASVIMVTIVIIVMKALLTSSSVATTGSISSGLEERSRYLVDRCREDLLQCYYKGGMTVKGKLIPLGYTDDNTAMVYRLPGNRDQAGNPVQGGTVKTGYISPLEDRSGFREALAAVIRFEAENILRESAVAAFAVAQPAAGTAPNWGTPFPPLPALREVILNSDVNRDGDRNDVYVSGKLKRYTVAPDGHQILTNPSALPDPPAPILGVETLSDNVVLAVDLLTGRFNGSMDTDAISDGLFRGFDGNGAQLQSLLYADEGRFIRITAWHGAFDDLRSAYLVRRGVGDAKWRGYQVNAEDIIE